MGDDGCDDRDRPTPDWVLPPEPPIHRAARRGDLAALQALLDAGADIDQRGDVEIDNGPHLRGLTPLMTAARSIDGATTETLRFLLDHGADLPATSEGGNTAAWYAAGDGGRWEFHRRATTPDHVERLRLLLDRGLDPNETNFVGRSLLVEAARAGDPARVALLLERGAKVCAGLAGQGTESRARLSGRQAPSAQPSADDSPPSGPKAKRSSLQIPLHCAAASGSAECVRLLLAAGCDPNDGDDSAQTPLHVAGSRSVVETLVAAGADVNASDQFGADPLRAVLEAGCCHGACGVARFEVARALLAVGAPMERLDAFGKSRLSSAAFGFHADSVEFLLALGADPRSTDSHGGTALHSIAWQGACQSPEGDEACRRIIEALVWAGADANARTHSSTTPLHLAVTGDWSSITAVRTLLALGADPDVLDDEGMTPLHLAISGTELACVDALLAAGADARIPTHDGTTAWKLAETTLAERREDAAAGPLDLRELGIDLTGIPGLSNDARREALHRRVEDAEAILAKLRGV